MKKNQNGFGILEVLVILLTLGILGFGMWYVWHSKKNSNVTSNSTQSSGIKPTKTVPSTDAYKGWKTYANQKYGFSFRYPSTWLLIEVPIDTPSGADPQEFAANLRFDVAEKYSEAAVFEIHTSNLETTTQFYDSYYGQASLNNVTKKTGLLKGKKSTQYDFLGSDQGTKQYLFAVGDKTYSFRSINEELNVGRSSSYWNDFDKVFSSLTIQ